MSKRKPNVLITNSVPLNGGDEALLSATILGIKEKLPNANITVLTNNKEMAEKFLPQYKFDYDWEFAHILNKNLSRNETYLLKIRKRLEKKGYSFISNLSMIFANNHEKRVINFYRNSDYIVSSAGGYIHDIYGYQWRSEAYSLALKFKKKLIFFAQSIGPFFKENDHEKIKNIFRHSYKLILREKYSQEHLAGIGYENKKNIVLGTDVAFALHHFFSDCYNEKYLENKRIAMCFRVWRSTQNNELIKKNAVKLLEFLINNGYSVDLISTCQGIDGYVDDSIFHEEILKSINDEVIYEKCKIINKKFAVKDLILKYGEYDAYIGMRLHGAILSMLGGTPAFNIAYEDKTKGIFEQMGLSDFQINFDADHSDIIKAVGNFLNVKKNLKNNLHGKIKNASNLAMRNFEIFK